MKTPPATPVQVQNLCALHSIELKDLGISWLVRLPSAQDELPKHMTIEKIIDRVNRLVEQSRRLSRFGVWTNCPKRYHK